MSCHFLSSMQFLLFLMGKLFIKPVFHQYPGVFSAISLLSSQWCQVRGASLALFLCPQASQGRCLIQQSTYILCCVLENVGVGVGVQGVFSVFPVNSQSLFGGGGWKQVFDESLAHLLSRRDKTHESLLFLTHTKSLARGLCDNFFFNPKQFYLDYVKAYQIYLSVKHGNNGLPLSDMKTLQVQYFQRKKPPNPKRICIFEECEIMVFA